MLRHQRMTVMTKTNTQTEEIQTEEERAIPKKKTRSRKRKRRVVNNGLLPYTHEDFDGYEAYLIDELGYDGAVELDNEIHGRGEEDDPLPEYKQWE